MYPSTTLTDKQLTAFTRSQITLDKLWSTTGFFSERGTTNEEGLDSLNLLVLAKLFLYREKLLVSHGFVLNPFFMELMNLFSFGNATDRNLSYYG